MQLKTRPRRDWNPNEAADDPPFMEGRPLMLILSHIPIPVHYCHQQLVTEYPSAFRMGGAI